VGISNRLGEKLPLSAELLIRRVTGDPHSAQWTIKATGLASLFYHGSKQSYLMSSYLLYYHEDILDSRRTHQQVVQQKFALRVKAGFNPFRDSAGCTIVTQWQRRLKSNSSEDQTLFLQPGRGTVHIFCEHLSPDDDSLQSQTEGLTRMRKKSF